MTNANLSISPEVIQMLGRKLYSSHPLPIVVRELLQNAVDACNRREIAPKIKIKVEIDTNVDEIYVTCTDNGEGMSRSTLLNKFLCLGESGKRDSKGGTGGFGIAKAAIMSNPFWSVHTHKLYTDVYKLGMPLAKVVNLDGTEVKVTIDENWYQSTIKDMLMMVYLSDVSIHLIVKKDDETIIDDQSAGLQSVGEKSVRDYVDYDDDNNKRFSIDLLKSFSLKSNGTFSRTIASSNAYRLNGLVQYVSTGNSNRKINAIIDLYTDLLPTDNKYPLSMSRENIQSTVRWSINEQLQKYDENPLSTTSIINNYGTEKKIIFNKGKQIAGELINNTIQYADSQVDKSNCAKVEDIPAIGKLQYILVFRDEKLTTEEKRILRLWAAIVGLVADVSETFGVGVTGEMSTNAQRRWENGTNYYLINTENMIDECHETMDALIHRLNFLACHEVMHFHQSGHNELFTSGMGSIYSQTIQKVLDNMPQLRSIIRANYK